MKRQNFRYGAIYGTIDTRFREANFDHPADANIINQIFTLDEFFDIIKAILEHKFRS